MRALAVAIVISCSRSTGPPAPAPAATPSAGTPRSDAPRTEAARTGAPVRWSNVHVVEGCFYFSGPFNGRDELLRGDASIKVDGNRMTLTLAAATFEGTLNDEAVALTRTTQRHHEGSWVVTETVTGTYRDGELRAAYRYEECASGEPCPGRCTMTADLSTR